MKKVKKQVRYFEESENSLQKKSKGQFKNKQIKKTNNKINKGIIKINVNLNKKLRHDKNNEHNRMSKIHKFPGKAPIKQDVLIKYKRGDGIKNIQAIKTNFHKKKIKKKERDIEWSTEQAARAELLLTEESGFLENEPGETTTQFTQHEIASNVDITSATKFFELHLNDFGPYRMKYTRNGRHLLLGGKQGHVAAFDWVTKKLHCETNVMESVHDVQWLHLETMFAVAQKNWVHVYDNQGIELHCLKKLYNVNRMEFLPYHFLLSTASEEGYLSWLDISIGEIVSQYNTKLGRLTMMTQNPYNALLCVGHAKGVVSMWSPNVREPLAKMLCHKAPMAALAVDTNGMYMATSSIDRTFKIWDIRKFKDPLQIYVTASVATNLCFSQKQLLGVGMSNIVEVYRDCCTQSAKRAYIRHTMNNCIENMAFCPYEDVMGVATAKGFTSLIIPGAGEANYDAFEVNPFQTKSQRREAEVKSILDKVQPELITLDPSTIAEVDVVTLKDKIEAKKNLLFVRPPKLNTESRKNKNISSVKLAKAKKIIKEQHKKEFIRGIKNTKIQNTDKKNKKNKKPYDVFDRFQTKNKHTK